MKRPTHRFIRASVLTLWACAIATGNPHAEAAALSHDELGWRLLVDGAPYFVKGMVWSYTPRGEDATFELFDGPDEQVRKVLDYEFALMKAAGVNTIRSFAMIPPKWVEYIYREYGIRSVINPMMGRYGHRLDGKWVAATDYSNRRARTALVRETVDTVRRYKDTSGVLMFAFGNESNYGLSWSSFEIEDLPDDDQEPARARYLYSLFEEVIVESRRLAPDHLFTIVNGDIQYLDLIAAEVPSLDLLGINAYRGAGFSDLWARVEKTLNLPVLLFEAGSDAFDAAARQEDQRAQAGMLLAQWQELYLKAHANREEGNSLGAFVFEWRDEWWKHGQTENLDVHDRTASWSNEGYRFDWEEGRNNMNEEWFGVMALGPENPEGVATAVPRLASTVLADVFAMDPYALRPAQITAEFKALSTRHLGPADVDSTETQ